MRIDAYNKVNQLYQTSAAKKIAGAEKAAASDSLVISQPGKDYQIAKQALLNIPDVREDKVACIKSAIASGAYNVTAEEVADKLVESYFDTSI